MKTQKCYTIASSQLQSPHRVSCNGLLGEYETVALHVICLYVCLLESLVKVQRVHSEWSTLWYQNEVFIH